MSGESTKGSVTAKINRIARGDADAESWMVQRYFERICSMARQRLGSSPRSAHDEEDVALTVMRNFLKGVKEGTFQRLQNRDDLDQILTMLTRRKSIDYFRRAVRRQENELGESVVCDAEISFAEVAVFDPPDKLVDEVAEELRSLFRGLEYKNLRLGDIAIWRLEGYSVGEIADKLNLLPHTVYRRLNLIKDRWRQHMKSLNDESGGKT